MDIATATKRIDEGFKGIVEQEPAKQAVKNILLGGVAENGFMPPMLFVAPLGTGKTKFLRAVKSITDDLFGRKATYFESGKGMGTPLAFYEDVLIPRVHGKESNVYADELHEATAPTLSVVRDLLEPNVERAPKRAALKDYEVLWHPYKNTFIGATNRLDLLDPPLVSRFERINLDYYTDAGMEQILFNGLQNVGIQFNENSLRKVAECNRGSARDVVKWVDSIRGYAAVRGKRTINKADINELLKSKNIFPLGVTRVELRTLQLLHKFGPAQLQNLAAKNGVSSAEQKANEAYLMQRGLIVVEGLRRLTMAGQVYLAELEKEKYI